MKRTYKFIIDVKSAAHYVTKVFQWASTSGFLALLQMVFFFLVGTKFLDMFLAINLLICSNIFSYIFMTLNLRVNSLLQNCSTIYRIRALRQLIRKINTFYSVLIVAVSGDCA